MESDLKPVEWILLFLFIGSLPNQPVIKDSLLLFEGFFILVREIKPELDTHFNFICYSCGPFSQQLKNDLGILQLLRFIKTRYFNSHTYYYLTDKGRAKAQEITTKLDHGTVTRIAKLRKNPGEWLARTDLLRQGPPAGKEPDHSELFRLLWPE